MFDPYRKETVNGEKEDDSLGVGLYLKANGFVFAEVAFPSEATMYHIAIIDLERAEFEAKTLGNNGTGGRFMTCIDRKTCYCFNPTEGQPFHPDTVRRKLDLSGDKFCELFAQFLHNVFSLSL